jgi:2-polyprenyl-6-methoxyphenol hydroxylase-like FAD-dependent oxidoreductase
MPAAQRVLIVGGGFSGMAAAIALRRRGVAVDLVEIDPQWRSYGAGISLSGATLRAFATLGVIGDIARQGFCGDGCDVCAADGRLLTSIPTPRIAGPDVPGGGGIMRPVLARIMAEATRASGARVRLGCTFTRLDAGTADAGDGALAEVAFDDGSTERYDLVIGADGLNSSVRATILPDAPRPKYTGQGVWRAVVPRPPEVVRAAMYMGRRHKAGVNPVSQQEMYLFLTEDRATNEYVPQDQLLPQLSALLSEFTAPVIAQLRAGLGVDSRIVYRPLEGLLVPRPWHRGRVLLIGDAVHATTPHLASGAGLGIEDGLVLAEELAAAGPLGQALERFQQRRWERCRLVVENSLRLGDIERSGGSQQEHADIMRNSMMALVQPV